jgi:hypothetical protein
VVPTVASLPPANLELSVLSEATENWAVAPPIVDQGDTHLKNCVFRI